MATIIDALVVTLGLDGSKFKSGSDQAQAALKKTGEQADRTAKDFDHLAKQMADGITRVRNEVLGLFALLTAGRGLKEMVSDIVAGDAATGRLAKTIGLSTQELSAWEQAAMRAGGSAEGIAGSMQNLSQMMETLRTTGQGGEQFVPWLSRLHVYLRDDAGRLKSLAQIYLDIASSKEWQALSPQSKTLYGQHFGMDQGTIALLSQGRDAVAKSLADANALGVPDDADAKNAQNLKNDLLDLQQAALSLARSVLNDLAPAIHQALSEMDDWVKANREWLATNIGDAIRDLRDFIMSIDWKAIGEGIQAFVGHANAAAEAVGGWKVATELLLGLWIGGTLTRALAGIGLMRVALLALIAEQGAAFIQSNSSVQGFVDWFDRRSGWLSDLDDWSYRHSGGLVGRSYQQQGVTPTPTSEQQKGLSKQAIDYFKSQGWTTEQAAGIVGNLQQESSFNPQAGKGTGHQGLAQWSAERQRDIEQHFGKALMSMSYQEQLAAVQWELTDGKYKAVGARLKQATAAAQAARIINHGYEIPANEGSPAMMAEDARRAANAAARQKDYEGTSTTPPAATGPSVGDRLRQWWNGQAPTGPGPQGPQTSYSLAHPTRYVPGPADRWGSQTQGATSNDNSSEVHINGPITIQSNATDSRGIAASLGGYLASANYTQSRRALA